MKQDILALPVEEQLWEARRRTELLINVRDRSKTELRDRLKRAGFTEAIIECEVEKAVAVGLIDDARFTQLYVAGKKRSGWGRLRIEKELRRFGIELRHSEGYPEVFFTPEDELSRAQRCMERFHSRAKNEHGARYRHLISRGFSTETAGAALGSFNRTHDQFYSI